MDLDHLVAKTILTELDDQEQEQDQDQFAYAMQLASSMLMPSVLKTVIELRVFDILAKAGKDGHGHGPRQLSASHIVSFMPNAKNPNASGMLDRMLNLLVGYSILTCSVSDALDDHMCVERLYGLSPVAKYFVSGDNGISLGNFLGLIQDPIVFASLNEAKDVVLEGGVPFERAHGMNLFEVTGKDHRFNEVLAKAMLSHTTIVMKLILDKYEGFQHVSKLVDVGGGVGGNLNMIVSKYSNVKAINFDLPHVVQCAPPYPGVEHVGGDMFRGVPEGDAIFMKWILHDWSDDECLKLLKNCYESLPKGGKVVAVEAILEGEPDKSSEFISTSLMDMIMLMNSAGGRERSKKEFLALATEAGFNAINFCCFSCNNWIMEFYK